MLNKHFRKNTEEKCLCILYARWTLGTSLTFLCLKDKIHRAELSHYKVPSENLALSMFHFFSLHSHEVVIYFIKPIVYTGTKTTYCRYFFISFIKLK